MKVEYNGHTVEGSVDEVKSLLDGNGKSERKKYDMTNRRKRKYTRRQGVKRRKWTPEEEEELRSSRKEEISYKEIGEKINKTPAQIKDKIVNMKLNGNWFSERKPRNGLYFSEDMKEYVLRAKKNNVPYLELTRRFNKKFGTNLTKIQMMEKYNKIREGEK